MTSPGRVASGSVLVTLGHGASLSGLLTMVLGTASCHTGESGAFAYLEEVCEVPYLAGGGAILAGGLAMLGVGIPLLIKGAVPKEGGEEASAWPVVEVGGTRAAATWAF